MVQASVESETPDLPQALKLLGEMSNNAQQVASLVDNMLERVKDGEMSTENGLSFLEMKYHMLLGYLINLTYIVLRKCSGEQIQSDPTVDRLIELRTVLEKIRPIDSKLKYQVDKLVKSAVAGDGSNDPQSLKANPDNLISKLNESEDSDCDDADTEKGIARKHNIYVPPKLAAAHFDRNNSKPEIMKRDAERARKKLLNSNVMRELKDEYSEAPLELSSGSRMQQTISKLELEKTEYEESYLTRLPVTKAEKNRKNKMTTMGVLGEEITNFGSSSGNKKKRKFSQKHGKGGKKRRFQ